MHLETLFVVYYSKVKVRLAPMLGQIDVKIYTFKYQSHQNDSNKGKEYQRDPWWEQV